MGKRVFLIVLDSLGIGELGDAKEYGDEGSNTLGAVMKSKHFFAPHLGSLGLFNIKGVEGGKRHKNPIGSFARLAQLSKGKDTTIGHWEMAGIISKNPLPTYQNGFPSDIIAKFEDLTKRKVLCNKPYSGTDVIRDFGKEHIKSGDLIVYTSADSVFQIAAHEDIIPPEKLYEYCLIARDIMQGEHGVGRIIARPFSGEYPYKRTERRKDFSLSPPEKTMLDILKENDYEVLAVGKIDSIFNSKGITESYTTNSNDQGMKLTLGFLKNRNFNGLCFVNLVDFDMLYGHRNDIDGYAKAVTRFDTQLGEFLKGMKKNDILIITADHGCDPSTPSTDHSREYVPMLIYGKGIKKGIDLGERESFSDISATILDIFDLPSKKGKSYYKEVKEEQNG